MWLKYPSQFPWLPSASLSALPRNPKVSVMRPLRTLVVGVALLGLAGSSVAAQEFEEAEREVEELRGEFTDAVSSLEELGAAIDRAERELIAAQGRLRAANEALAGLEAEIEQAEAAVIAAERRHDEAVAEVALAEAEVADALDRVQEADDRLHRRAIEVFKFGAGHQQQTFVTGVVGSADWHEVAVTTSAIGRIVGNDKELILAAEAAREEALEAEEAAVRARAHAVDLEAEAQAEAAELQVLVEEQREAVEAVEAEQRRREAILRSFEEDQELMAELAARLEGEIATARANAERIRQEEEARRAEEAAAREAAAEAGEDPPDLPSDLSWASKLPGAGQQWAPAINEAATRHGLDPRLFAALVWSESGFNPNAVSHAGAIGLAQLMPGTAAMLGVDPWNPEQNLDGGSRYLKLRIDQFGSIELGLAAYNAGATRVQEAGPGIPNIAETQFYVFIVMQRYNQLAS